MNSLEGTMSQSAQPWCLLIAYTFGHTFSCTANIQEQGRPGYCNAKTFERLEVFDYQDVLGKGDAIHRQHVFKLGQIVLTGVAIGASKTGSIEKIAIHYSPHSSNDQFCTWYLNIPSAQFPAGYDAERAFLYAPIRPNPRYMAVKEGVAAFEAAIGSQFSDSHPSFVSCLAKHSYLALGCNSMKHRGPSVFGMLLSYSGCEPESSLQIVNSIWGANGVDDHVRLAIIRWAFDYGASNPTSRLAVQSLLQSAQ